MPDIRCPYCVERGQFKVMVRDPGDYFLCDSCKHTSIPGNLQFHCTCPNCILLDRRATAGNLTKVAGSKKTPELIMEPTPSGSPILRGHCSICPKVIFAVVGNTEENQRRLQQAFDRHFQEIHHLSNKGAR
jgi:hypothetical protein